MYGGENHEDKEEQIRILHEERRQIVEKYDLGREDGAVIDDWEDPKFEIYHKTDRFGFITDSRLPDAGYRTEKQQKQLDKEMSRLPKWLKMEKEKNKWFPIGSKYHDKMVERVWKGVPERLRGSLWSILLDLDRIKQEQVGKYQEMKDLARKYSPDIRQIDLDVNRYNFILLIGQICLYIYTICCLEHIAITSCSVRDTTVVNKTCSTSWQPTACSTRKWATARACPRSLPSSSCI